MLGTALKGNTAAFFTSEAGFHFKSPGVFQRNGPLSRHLHGRASKRETRGKFPIRSTASFSREKGAESAGAWQRGPCGGQGRIASLTAGMCRGRQG